MLPLADYILQRTTSSDFSIHCSHAFHTILAESFLANNNPSTLILGDQNPQGTRIPPPI